MSDASGIIISVRGEAERMVSPDSCVLRCGMRLVAGSKADALAAAAAAQRDLVADLAGLGGVAHTAGADRQPLEWSAWSASTEPEYDHDKMTGRHGPTGNVVAQVSIALHVRDFARLDELNALLARHEHVDVHEVTWAVDADNPAWPEVRAAAIHAAILRGRDYAAALNGAIVRVEQVADAGLLGEGGARHGGAMPLSFHSVAAAGPDAPSLDPVPQRLLAAIDARLVAAVPPLA